MSGLFTWLLRHVLLVGLSAETIEACIAQPAVRAVLRFRFAYLFAFHGPVLVPLLDALSGQHDPALAVLSLGVSSLTMVFSDIPTGLYADRHGAKAAIRLGLLLTCVILFGFFLLGLWRAQVLSQGHTGPWLPGIVGLLVLEIAIGCSLSLMSGADTVLFLHIARRSRIPELASARSEGIGSAVRYLGTMISVCIGACLYDVVSTHLPTPALRLVGQSSLFLLTLAGQLVALRALRHVDPPMAGPEASSGSWARPGLRTLLRAVYSLRGWPAFAQQLWLLCWVSATALFAVYLFQSPLSRLATQLAQHWPVLWPLYTCVSILGYWACARGARASHTQTKSSVSPQQSEPTSSPPARTLPPRTHTFFGAALTLLLLYPASRLLGAWLALPGLPLHLLTLIAVIITSLGFNAVRGFVEPYAAALLIAFSRQHALAVPASLVSAFSAAKRSMHFGLCLTFYLARRLQPSTQASDDSVSQMVLCAALLMALAAVPAWLLRRAWQQAHRARLPGA